VKSQHPRVPFYHRALSRAIPFFAAGALACGGLLPADEPVRLRLLTWNVGNVATGDPHYALRIADRRYEDHVAARIRELAPDVVLLQEVLAPARCARFVERDASRTCHDAAHREPTVRRLLGPGYTIVCDGRRQVECIGVKTSFGAIPPLERGALALGGAETPPLPLVPCERALGECSDERCDAESGVSAVRVETERGAFRLVHVHQMAPGRSAAGLYWGEPCRHAQLRQAFALAGAGANVVAGDFNLDPDRFVSERESAVWTSEVGAGRRFRDLTPRAADGTSFATRRSGLGVATDHVLVEGGSGACRVHGRGLGPAPGTDALDAGFDWSLLPGGERDPGRIDHLAISCTLELELAE
jgi:endonuclease/exonuclease/phosphatase family metal-dependent hydrolase